MLQFLVIGFVIFCNSMLAQNVEAIPSFTLLAKAVNGDEIETPDVGAYKVYKRALSWNRARSFCYEQGGHLAVIKSDSEVENLYQLMKEESVEDAWIGLHDAFEEGDWTSVNDEPIANVWAVWYENNPDNYGGNQNCARFVRELKALDDESCTLYKSFICKMSTV